MEYSQDTDLLFPSHLDENIVSFRTINDFRSKRMKKLHSQFIHSNYTMLVELGHISMEKYKERLENKIHTILSKIDEGILSSNNAPEDGVATNKTKNTRKSH